MKIAYIIAKRSFGLEDGSGYSTHISELNRSMTDLGHEVLMCLGCGGKPVYHLGKNGKSDWKKALKNLCPQFIWEGLKDIREIQYNSLYINTHIDKIRAFDPDIVYERTTGFHYTGKEISRILAKPLILEHNCPQMEERILSGKSPFTSRGSRIDLENFRYTDGIITVSSALRNRITDIGIDKGKITVIPNAADTDFFSPEKANGEEIRERYGLKNKKIVGFVGSFFRWHGIDTMIECAEKVIAFDKNLHFLIVGDGEIKNELEIKAASLGVSNLFTFTGKVPYIEIPDYINAIDIAVMPGSNWYGSPVKIFEYGAMKKPIIAPDTEPVRDVMVPEEDGILIRPGSKIEFIKAVKQYMEYKDFRDKCAENFHKKVLGKHTWKNNGKATLEFMKYVIERNRREG